MCMQILCQLQIERGHESQEASLSSLPTDTRLQVRTLRETGFSYSIPAPAPEDDSVKEELEGASDYWKNQYMVCFGLRHSY